jgi:hypothetical protein
LRIGAPVQPLTIGIAALGRLSLAKALSGSQVVDLSVLLRPLSQLHDHSRAPPYFGSSPFCSAAIASSPRRTWPCASSSPYTGPTGGLPCVKLLKLGIDIAERTVSRLLPKRPTPPSQTWRTFLTNHVRDLVAVDFFTLPTARLRGN